MRCAIAHKHGGPAAAASVTLDHAARHLRRKRLTLDTGEDVMVDLPKAVQLAHGDRLVLEDGDEVEIRAASQKLLCVIAKDAVHHAQLCWHLGNRHRPSQIEAERILIEADPVLQRMLEGLGARITELTAPFQPVRGAYHDHSHE